MTTKRHKPGSYWRFLAWLKDGAEISDESTEYEEASIFDELVVDRWLHIEQMSTAHWWMAIYRDDGSRLCIEIDVAKDGQASSVYTYEDY